jgi:hypothetical protein
MPKAQRTLTKVIYKPSTQSTDEYTIIVNNDEVSSFTRVVKIVNVDDYAAPLSITNTKTEVSLFVVSFVRRGSD